MFYLLYDVKKVFYIRLPSPISLTNGICQNVSFPGVRSFGIKWGFNINGELLQNSYTRFEGPMAVTMKMGYGHTWFNKSVLTFRRNRLCSILIVDK
jgi:hypothetical protein